MMPSVERVPQCDDAFVLQIPEANLDMHPGSSTREYECEIPSAISNLSRPVLVLHREDKLQLEEVHLHVRCFDPIGNAYGFFLTKSPSSECTVEEADDKIVRVRPPFQGMLDPAFANRCLLMFRAVFHQPPGHAPVMSSTWSFHSPQLQSRLLDQSFERPVSVHNGVDPVDNALVYQGNQVHLRTYEHSPYDEEVVGEEQVDELLELANGRRQLAQPVGLQPE